MAMVGRREDDPMPAVGAVFAILAAVAHVLFFAMESVLFMRPEVHRRFGVRTLADAEVIRPMAYNQGFYNLFLACGAVVGVVLAAGDRDTEGTAVTVFACACMVGAAAVLLSTGRRYARAAAVQSAFPLLALLFIWFG